MGISNNFTCHPRLREDDTKLILIGIIMYIGNIVQEKINRTEKKRPKMDSGSVFSLSNPHETEEAANVSPMPKAQVSTAWMLQEVDGYAQDQKKMRQTGDRLLKNLNELRVGILLGEITAENMQQIKEALDDSKIELQFPELQAVVDDIKLRAEVELAKLEMRG